MKALLQGPQLPPFLSKTYDLEGEPQLDGVISWGPSSCGILPPLTGTCSRTTSSTRSSPASSASSTPTCVSYHCPILCSHLSFLLQSLTGLLFMMPSSAGEALCFCLVSGTLFRMLYFWFCSFWFLLMYSTQICCVYIYIYILFVLPFILLVRGVVVCNANLVFLLLAESWSVMPIWPFPKELVYLHH
ncbi:unnamed protein product [Triticum turgidum subsp. durum]|uniref:Uncharacterized protein n=1 Tax=Triticum turgidum subsp. durum TaxID=4567 RepID=A0A9R1A6R1_TRITD|nr:unnamed protein product [Triticum turgidum subsp. durum]